MDQANLIQNERYLLLSRHTITTLWMEKKNYPHGGLLTATALQPTAPITAVLLLELAKSTVTAFLTTPEKKHG